MKEKIKGNIDDKKKEVIYCVIIVIVIVLLAFGDQIVLRFLEVNPNPTNRVFGGGTSESYQISFLEGLSLEDVLDKIENQETFLLLSSQEDCYTCEKYLPVLEEEIKTLPIPLYYIDRNLYDSSMTVMQQFINLDSRIVKNITYTPYLMYFKDGVLQDETVGKKDMSELEKFLAQNGIIEK